MDDPRVDIFFSEIDNDLSSESSMELASLFAEYIVECSPFATDEFSENNYMPREW